MTDLNSIPELAVGGTTAITYTHDTSGRVIAACCADPDYRLSRGVRRHRKGNPNPWAALEALFYPNPPLPC